MILVALNPTFRPRICVSGSLLISMRDVNISSLSPNSVLVPLSNIIFLVHVSALGLSTTPPSNDICANGFTFSTLEASG